MITQPEVNGKTQRESIILNEFHLLECNTGELIPYISDEY